MRIRSAWLQETKERMVVVRGEGEGVFGMRRLITEHCMNSATIHDRAVVHVMKRLISLSLLRQQRWRQTTSTRQQSRTNGCCCKCKWNTWDVRFLPRIDNIECKKSRKRMKRNACRVHDDPHFGFQWKQKKSGCTNRGEQSKRIGWKNDFRSAECSSTTCVLRVCQLPTACALITTFTSYVNFFLSLSYEKCSNEPFPRLLVCVCVCAVRADLIFILLNRFLFAPETRNQNVKRLIKCVCCVRVPLSARTDCQCLLNQTKPLCDAMRPMECMARLLLRLLLLLHATFKRHLQSRGCSNSIFWELNYTRSGKLIPRLCVLRSRTGQRKRDARLLNVVIIIQWIISKGASTHTHTHPSPEPIIKTTRRRCARG